MHVLLKSLQHNNNQNQLLCPFCAAFCLIEAANILLLYIYIHVISLRMKFEDTNHISIIKYTIISNYYILFRFI